MSARLTSAELLAMEARFRAMGGVPSKTLSQAELREMEDRFRKSELQAAIRTFRSTSGKRTK